MKKSTAITIVIITLIALFFLVLGFFVVNQSTNDSDEKQSPINTTDENYETEANFDSENATNEKTSIISKNETSTHESSDGSKNSIEPVIVYAYISSGQLEASAYAPVVEENGNCTFLITNNSSGDIITKQVSAIPDASTTRCEHLVLSTNEIGTGTSFSVIVEYSSEKSEGTSKAHPLEIQ